MKKKGNQKKSRKLENIGNRKASEMGESWKSEKEGHPKKQKSRKKKKI